MKNRKPHKSANSRAPFRAGAEGRGKPSFAKKPQSRAESRSDDQESSGFRTERKGRSDFRSGSSRPAARSDDRGRGRPSFSKKPRESAEFRSNDQESGGFRTERKGESDFRKPRSKFQGETRDSSNFRSNDKPRFGEKKRFGKSEGFSGRGKPSFRSDDEDRGKSDFKSDDRPRFGNKKRFDKKEGFGEKPRPYRSRDEEGGKPSFSKKPRGGSDFRNEGKSDFRKSRPDFRKDKPERRDQPKYVSEGVLIWGLHAARAAFLNPKRRVTRLWLSEAGQKLFADTQKEAHDELLKRPDPKQSDREDLNQLLPPNSVHQGIVIECAALNEPSLHDIIGQNPPPALILMLDQVTDPHNVGAILRSAAAFGAGAVIMTERNAPTTTGVLAKSASGALEHVPMIHVVNLARTLDDLREAGYWCVGLAEEGAKSLGELDMSGRTVLVLGAEGDGLRYLTRQKCDELARLPTGGPVGSLNVSNAAAVALYEVRRQAK